MQSPLPCKRRDAEAQKFRSGMQAEIQKQRTDIFPIARSITGLPAKLRLEATTKRQSASPGEAPRSAAACRRLRNEASRSRVVNRL